MPGDRLFWVVIVALATTFACSSSDSGTTVPDAAVSEAGAADGADAASGTDSGTAAQVDAGPKISVKILKPVANTTFKNDDQVALEVTATDLLGKAITDPTFLIWTTDLSPEPIGQGPTGSFTITGAAAGPHKIKLTASDPAGHSASDEVTVQVK